MSNRWFAMPDELLTDASLSDGDRIVYMLLLSFCDYGTTSNAFPSAEQAATRGNRKDRSSVVRSLKRLAEAGWITREKRYNAKGQTSSVYRFPRQPDFQRGAQKPHGEVRKSATTLQSLPKRLSSPRLNTYKHKHDRGEEYRIHGTEDRSNPDH